MKRPTSSLTRGLRLTAALALVSVLAVWTATGAHVGWTQTTRLVLQHDEITGIDYPIREPAFIAGVEIVALGVGAAAAFAGLSLLTARRSRPVTA